MEGKSEKFRELKKRERSDNLEVPNFQIMQTQFTELSDSQWEIIEKFFLHHQPKRHSIRNILNAILWITRTGTQWRNLESKYPKWESVYYYFNLWRKSNLLSEVLATLTQLERVRQGADPEPSALAIDSQSVKAVALLPSDSTGLDAGKKVNGRKRHMVVDKLGLLIAIIVTKANTHDGEAGVEMLWQIEKASKRVALIRADGTYGGVFKEISEGIYGWQVETTQMPSSTKGFVPQKGRWQVERSFAWLNFFRRLTRDYEKLPESHALFVQLAFSIIILNRLAS